MYSVLWLSSSSTWCSSQESYWEGKSSTIVIDLFYLVSSTHNMFCLSLLYKVLVFVMTAFMPTDNDFEKGGQSFKLLCT